jgi:hypothetical protein
MEKVQATLWSSTSSYNAYVDFVHGHEIKGYTCLNFHPSLFEVSQIRGVATIIKICLSDRSVDRRIKIVRRFLQVFETYRMMYNKL